MAILRHIIDAINSARESRRLQLFLGSFLITTIPVAFVQRTIMLQGVGYFEYASFLLVALAALPFFFTQSSEQKPSTFSGRSLAICLLLIPFVDLPLKIGLGLLGASGVLQFLPGKYFGRIAERYVQIAAALVVAILVFWTFQYVAARLTDYRFLSIPLAMLFSMAGITNVVDENVVFIRDFPTTIEVLASPDKFGGAFFPVWLTSCWTLGLAIGIRRMSFIWMAVAGVGFYYARAAIVVSGIAASVLESNWWAESFIFLSFAPLVILWWPLCQFKSSAESESNESRDSVKPRLALRAFLGGLAGTFLITLGWLWADPGTVKTGKIIIDERYSRWEWSEVPLDTTFYGVKTVYSYSCMVETLRHYFDDVAQNFGKIDDVLLKDASILVLKTPTESYQTEDRQAIWRFVERGGGIWLIGDHTDIFGMNTNLNAVAEPYGIEFGADSVIDPAANRQLFLPNNFPHSIVKELPLFLWYTGCSLRSPWGIRDVILSDRMLFDQADYSTNTFFGDFTVSLAERVGPVVQATAIHSGRGRVAAWTDSTLFSNFSIYMPGKMELALGYVDWLNRENSFTWVRPWLMLAGVVILLAGCILYGAAILYSINSAWLGISIAGLSVVTLNQYHFYPSLIAKRAFDTVAFYEPRLQSGHFPRLMTFSEPTTAGHLTSFIAAQRVGKRPYLANSWGEAFQSGSIVWIDPDRELSEIEQSEVSEFLESGGRLMVLAGTSNSRYIEAFLTGFSIPFGHRDAPDESEPPIALPDWARKAWNQSRDSGMLNMRSVYSVDGNHLGFTDSGLYLTSGDVLAVSGGRAVIACYSIGNGKILVSVCAGLFSDESLGENSSVPNKRQKLLLELLFDWYSQGHRPKDAVIDFGVSGDG